MTKAERDLLLMLAGFAEVEVKSWQKTNTDVAVARNVPWLAKLKKLRATVKAEAAEDDGTPARALRIRDDEE